MNKVQRLIYFTIIISLIIISASDSNNFTADSCVSTYERDVLILINKYRASYGLKQLSFSTRLNRLAKQHSQYMQRKSNLSHDLFSSRFQQAKCFTCVENVGWNYSTPKAQFNGWRNSPGHNRNMLNRSINVAGISKVGPYVTFFACKCR